MENIIDDLQEDLDQSTHDWELFIGSNSNYYTSNWKNIKEGKYLSFNLAACFFVVFWMMYRKMYVECGVMFLLIFGQGYLEVFLVETFNLYQTQMYWSMGLDIFVAFIIGFIGNALYLKKAERTIRRIKYSSTEPSNDELDIQNAGGTSPLLLGISAFIFIAYFSWDFYF